MERLENSPSPEPVRFLLTPAGSFRLERLPDGSVRVTPPAAPAEHQGLILRVITGLGDRFRVESHGDCYLLAPLPSGAAG